MKKMILLLSFTLLCVAGSYAVEDYWADINFSRDSVLWGQGTTPPQPNNQEYDNRVFGDYSIHGFFGRFNASMRKLNSENEEEQFIMSWRLSRSAKNHLTFPVYDNIGRIKIHYFNSSADYGCYFYLKYNNADPEEEPNWVDFDPIFKMSIPKNDGGSVSAVIDTVLNINSPTQLRIVPITYQSGGTGNYYLQVYSVQISKAIVDGVDPTSIVDNVNLRLVNRNLDIKTDLTLHQASIYNLSGVKVGELRKGDTYKFQLPGQYIVKVETAQGTVVKKLAVF